ncbi:MAG: undecaprenyldiphospho-muramoylpentapeptide beta-N-acetylglucosaminyltransferase [Campylobacterales bacterium]|nr:undecaprenyldiphospho-muramoylpentapeptide beta-N-acetylglucosaminyltransferase [Campylobacterales bacterium]
MSIVMTGGGTGGHLVIIKALKEHLSDEELIYIGSTIGQDKAWFEKDEDFKQRYFLDTRGVVNQKFFGKIFSLWLLLKATIRSFLILKKQKARVVFCVGGFSAAPTSIAALLSGTPLVIHEQNALSGTLNRRLKRYARYFISSYDSDSLVHSYPIKEEFFTSASVRKKIKKIIFLGGSQGAKAINDLALKLAPWLQEQGIAIVHQAGEKNIKTVQKRYTKLGIKAEVFGFTKEPAKYMSESDLAIARSGASTLWELSANGLPAIFIPFPYAAGDHQYYNAKFLTQKELAWVIRERDLKIKTIKDIILKANIEQKSKGLLEIIKKDGAQEIAKIIKSV